MKNSAVTHARFHTSKYFSFQVLVLFHFIFQLISFQFFGGTIWNVEIIVFLL